MTRLLYLLLVALVAVAASHACMVNGAGDFDSETVEPVQYHDGYNGRHANTLRYRSGMKCLCVRGHLCQIHESIQSELRQGELRQSELRQLRSRSSRVPTDRR